MSPAAGVWESLSAAPLSAAIRESVWLYPFLETVHIIGLALLVGSIIAFDLRILGRSPAIAVGLLGRHLLPWVWIGFALNVISGVLLFASDAVEFAANPALRAKLALIAAAGVNAALFQHRFARDTSGWETACEVPLAARLSALLSIGLWLAILVAGRMIAYVA